MADAICESVEILPISFVAEGLLPEDGVGAMRFNVTVDRDEVGIWIVECPSIPGCVSQGSTRDEALESIREALRVFLERKALGSPGSCLNLAENLVGCAEGPLDLSANKTLLNGFGA